MKIKDHKLCKNDEEAYPFVESPNTEGALDPSYLVIHYTAGRGFDQSVAWLSNPQAAAAAHLVIGRQGEITQLAPFDKVAWHAGASAWRNLSGMNGHSIGIELDNAGKLQKQGNRWQAWFGRLYDEDQVIVATHRHEDEPAGWHAYTEVQMDALIEVASLLVAEYDLKDIIGHEDIAPGRKTDPGPAFSLSSLRGHVYGRTDTSRDRYKTRRTLNIRTGPESGYPTVEGSPLAEDAEVEIVDGCGPWCLVEATGPVNDVVDVEGWVHGRYLRPV